MSNDVVSRMNVTRMMLLLIGAILVTALLGCRDSTDLPVGPRVIVLGIDGMDHALTQGLIASGQLPNFARLQQQGYGGALETSVPPLSPVAWSEFVTGLDAGGHGIFDFIHRDPTTMQPYLSTSRVDALTPDLLPSRIEFGDCVLPLTESTAVNLRQGEPFWSRLEASGIPTHIIRMPANYPPSGSASVELSGMGTPDLMGTYGTFSFFGSGLFTLPKTLDGGRVYAVDVHNGQVNGRLAGPANPFTADNVETGVDFTVEVLPEEAGAVITVAGIEHTLKAGEWSPWMQVEFEFDCVPFVSLAGTVRFYLRQAHPDLELYVTPVNIDPMAPATPLSTPSDFAEELASATGRYYTQGMMEDTKALSAGVLTREEFLSQANNAREEVEHQYRHLLTNFKTGFMFYYFGNLDQVTHMMYRHQGGEATDTASNRDPGLANVVPNLYRNADAIVGHTLEQLNGEDLLIVMSDHGFAPWKRSFSLNNWLRDEGYLAVKNANSSTDPGLLQNVDWERTRAYGLGFNGLYINQQGREANGVVTQSESGPLIEELAERLKTVIDPRTGMPAITRTYIASSFFTSKDHLAKGPDIVVGYARGTRNHSDSAVGKFGLEVFSDNLDEWSGDHAMDHTVVPGILFTSRPLAQPAASLRELSASILSEFEVD